ncbi:hypothetical protein [Haloplasma contractile]|uniref:Uncharacterized protein n=1 Tax=Haloplasma contractile SSD-17B TaxID=1033810 RepID=U2FJJ2_9MOLU|nr:hypothetical protein [Haloplasma contractile]ERJ11429.1 hypothetical protein HLPCO_002551 [Haloplasma contractile SSD-17B]
MNLIMEHIRYGIRFNYKFIMNNTKLSVAILVLLLSSYLIIVQYNLKDYLPFANFRQIYLFLVILVFIYMLTVARYTRRHFLLKHHLNHIKPSIDIYQAQMMNYLKCAYNQFNQLYRSRRSLTIWTIMRQFHFLKAYCYTLKLNDDEHYAMVEHDLNQKMNVMFRKALKVTIIDLLILNVIPFFMLVRLDLTLLMEKTKLVQTHDHLFLVLFLGFITSMIGSIVILIVLYFKLNNDDLSTKFIKKMLLISNLMGGLNIFRTVGSFATLLAIRQFETLGISTSLKKE